MKINLVDFVDVFGGYVFSNNNANNGYFDLINTETNDGQQVLFGDEKYVHAGLMLNLTPSISLYAGGSFIDIAKTNRFQYKTQHMIKSPPVQGPGGWINYRYFGKVEEHEQSFDVHIKQYELYLNGKLQLDQGWAVNLFTNLLFINTPIVQQVWYSENITDTLRYNTITGNIHSITYQDENVDFIEKDSSFVNWVAGFNLAKRFRAGQLWFIGYLFRIIRRTAGANGFVVFLLPTGQYETIRTNRT